MGKQSNGKSQHKAFAAPAANVLDYYPISEDPNDLN
jgi:hypothetical protein